MVSSLLTCTLRHRSSSCCAWRNQDHASIILQRLHRRRRHGSRNSADTASSISTTTRPIVIVGGGPVGLFLSNLLSTCYNVPSVLLESQSVEERFQHPQAHFLNTRSMEILRSHLPDIYQNVLHAMPAKRQWQAFQYTHCMTATEPLATVLHPVHAPIQAGVDANGTLLPLDHHGTASSSSSSPADAFTKFNSTKQHTFLSPCTVGHLAQHTFGRILYQAAVRAANRVDGSAIYYESRVTKVSGNTTTSKDSSSKENLMQVTTADGRVFETDIVVAADGANSLLRSWNKIGWSCMSGNKVQHIMNIHVNLTKDQVAKLHRLHDDGSNKENNKDEKNFAMLYSVYSSQALAMVVCHDLGDYVVQIPYFPPLETEQTFRDASRLGPMLEAIFGFSICLHTQVVSIGKWTMATRVADSYYYTDIDNDNSNKNNVVLVGDAGHVFPPAGGFGMNTGIQDAHNLGWKLAWAMRKRQKDNINNKKWKAVFKSYDQERRPVALRNAALAHRNYHRVMETIRQCYLDDEIPTMVTKALTAAPFLPSLGKTFTFRALQQTAMKPLSWLESSRGLYREHIKANLRRVLQRGMGLSLIFPRHELFFTYDKNNNGGVVEDLDDINNSNWYRSTDTVAPLHVRVVVGQRLPHVDIQVLSSPSTCAHLTTSSTLCTSTIDLAAHVARQHGQPSFCLLHVVRDCDSLTSVSLAQDKFDRCLQSLAKSLSTQMEIPVAVIHLVTTNVAVAGPTKTDEWVVQLATVVQDDGDELDGNAAEAGNIGLASNPFISLLLSSGGDCNASMAALVLVRPDGHVAHVVKNYWTAESSNKKSSDYDTNVEGDLLLAALQSGGAM